ncbi:DUF1236 domain-containing protein [Methylobacterium sp. ID0610]|uniref:DUF1236 domain-containing protein n=1 Tax=Methylobacterium carpenticola TaxID=3344827 RepID=UPI0036999904
MRGATGGPGGAGGERGTAQQPGGSAGREGTGRDGGVADQGSQRGGAERAGGAERSGERAAERGDRDTQRGERAAERSGGRTDRGERTGAIGEARGASSRLDTRQRTEFRQTIVNSGVRPLRGASFALSVGTAVPRSVTLHALPPTIVSLVPAYRGLRYVLVDDEIVIIDPDTYEIVDVIPG